LRQQFWKDVRIVGGGEEFNKNLEMAGRVADYFELGDLIARDATRCARCLSDVEPPSPTATDRVEAEAIAAARARARELRSKS
jgi:hypothetical protein